MYCLVLLFLTLGQVLANCPNGWTAHGESCYHVSRDVASWVEALKMCEVHGSYLVRVETAFEDNFLASMIRSLQNHVHTYWMGGSDWTTEGEWTWEPQGAPFVYTNWYRHQPDNHAGQDNCLAMEGSSFYKWTDENCQDKYRYICERA
ncbi:perlucin-like protein [Ylistrum balloti]|uniref:perlucin-like protein n=1 Tax=Ylistrum balloti TaxID=509963 RepID=UPI00290586D9|nr:perlucin-like protein [Ylistrum balloti]